MGTALRLERRGEIGVIWFDQPGESVNALSLDLEEELKEVLAELEGAPDLIGAVFASGKADSFVVGADVEALVAVLGDSETAAEFSRRGQEAVGMLAASPKPIVAAVHGSCLGGGLELAIACAGRVASDHPATEFGLPEVQLGLIPGASGTQRLPQLIGVDKALDLILTGRQIDGRRARRWGLVDDLVHPAILLDVAADLARRIAGGEPSSDGPDRLNQVRRILLQENPAGRRLVFSQARSRTMEQTKGNLPGPLLALEVVRIGLEQGIEAGLRSEAKVFGRLAATPQAEALIGVFQGRQRANRQARALAVDARRVRQVAVIGSGLMGAGIAGVTAARLQVPVLLQDVTDEALRSGLRGIREYLDHRVRSRRIRPQERDRLMSLIHPTTDDHRSLGRVDLAIEAVVESLDVKHGVLRSFEDRAPEHAVFASNTSSIPIARIAEASRRPGQVIGMHYFSPVPQIPLLEVIPHPGTADWVIATAVEVGRRQGKTVIVVNDGPGFYTSRILAPYLNEATALLAEGASVEQIDAALEGVGFPVGPFRLVDEVGIDVGAEIAVVLEEAFGERMRPDPLLARLVENGRRGRKNGRGFYQYVPAGDGYERQGVDESVYRLVDVDQPRHPSPDEIVERCLLQMMNEAAWALSDGVVRAPVDGDVGAVFGLGFPPHLGGPFREMDRRGTDQVLAQLERYAAEHGDRFRPAPVLAQAAGRPFHPATAHA